MPIWYDEELDMYTVRGKWIYSGCGSIDEMKERLDEVKDTLTELQDEGYKLTDGGDDYLFLQKWSNEEEAGKTDSIIY